MAAVISTSTIPFLSPTNTSDPDSSPSPTVLPASPPDIEDPSDSTIPLPLQPPASRTSPPYDPYHRQSYVNLYFLIFALVILIALFGYFFHRRRKARRRAQRRSLGQTALARDLERWGPGRTHRRWMHGAWWGSRDNQALREQDGLDERGEAPPPYRTDPVQKTPEASTEALGRSGPPDRTGRRSSANIAIPLHSVTWHRVDPPGYEESVRQRP
ncbi:MAG: hypothetical protein M1817_002270 [Caeruleum heppii]|nr:MAG: hypothetical protein M1817_002270 [Caeruleum heppii]